MNEPPLSPNSRRGILLSQSKGPSALVITNKPFFNEPERNKDAIWIKHEIVVKVQFKEWTPNHTMRHPSIQAFVNASLKDCTFS